MTYGEKIRQRRRRVGLSQRELAAKANLEQHQVSAAELGKSATLVVQQRLKGVLGVRPDIEALGPRGRIEIDWTRCSQQRLMQMLRAVGDALVTKREFGTKGSADDE